MAKSRYPNAASKQLVVWKPQNRWFMKWGIFAIILLVILFLAGRYWFSHQPQLIVENIADVYTEGDTVHFQIHWQNRQLIELVSFVAGDGRVEELWYVKSIAGSKQGSFKTIGWLPNRYTYIATITDRYGNSHSHIGHFQILKRDIVQPHCEISGIDSQYRLGEKIRYNLQATDDKSLKRMTFSIPAANISQTWQLSGQQAVREGDLQTDDWRAPQKYIYTLKVTDMANNDFEHTGSFWLRDTDRIAPQGRVKGIQPHYLVGDTIQYEIIATDDEKLQTLTFSVAGNLVKQIWHVNTAHTQHQSSFITTGWQAGTYAYTLEVTDHLNNRSVFQDEFTLTDLNKSTKKPLITTLKGLENNYTIGETIHYALQVSDPSQLKQVIFEVHPNRIRKVLSPENIDPKLTHTFNTEGWSTGIYTYFVSVEDREGNISQAYVGTFKLNPPLADKTPTLLEQTTEAQTAIDENLTPVTEQTPENIASEITAEKTLTDVSPGQKTPQAQKTAKPQTPDNQQPQTTEDQPASTQQPSTNINPAQQQATTVQSEETEETLTQQPEHAEKITDIDQSSTAEEAQKTADSEQKTKEEQESKEEKEEPAETSSQPPAAEIEEKTPRQPPIDQAVIDRQLQQCQHHFQGQRYTVGSTGNALDCYQAVLQKDPDNQTARKGIENIADKYIELTRWAINRQKWQKARVFIRRLQRVDNNATALPVLKRQLQQAIAAQRQPRKNRYTPPPKPRTPKPSPAPTKPRKIQPIRGCENCNCADLLTQLSIGVEPLTAAEKQFLTENCY